MATEQTQFYQLLESLLSPDNNIRQQAESAYSNLSRDVKVAHLLAAVHNVEISEEARLMAAVVLRRLFTSDFTEFYKELQPESKKQLLQQVLLAIQLDLTRNLQSKICEVVAEVARNLIDETGKNEWPELLQFLFQCANSNNLQLQESALRIFASVPNVFGNQETKYLDLIKQMLQKSLGIDVDIAVRFQAVRAVGAFILIHEKNIDVLKRFTDLLPNVLSVTALSIEEQTDQTLLKLLIDLTEGSPKFLRSQLDNIFDLFLKVFSNSDIDDSWRHLALEVLVSFSENSAPLVRKSGVKYIAELIPMILQMMTDLDDDENWSLSDKIEEEDNSDNNVIAESSLDRLSCGLGGKTVLPFIIASIPTMLSSTDWKQRHAALMAISAIGEGCHKHMAVMLDDIMSGVLNFLNDPHPRVRYAACNAIGQMATDFAPIFEKKFHSQVIPGLLSVLDDVENPRVQTHAGAALVNFSEDCPKYILTKYLDGIMIKLEAILNAKFKELVEKGNKLVLEQVVTTIASVADTCEKEFGIYYDRLMPCLKYIIQNANIDHLRTLRGKTIECVSLIGLAVGSEKFMQDANEVMNMLLKTHSEGDFTDEDPQTSYLISAWARMCKIMGKEFEQYLPLVMGPVLRTASMKPEVALLDNDEVEDMEREGVDWSVINLGEQQNFAIRTAGMEDKASACEMLVCYARELKEGFADYAEEVVRLMVPLLKFYFHDGVRLAAAESLPCLLDCAKIKGLQYLEGMWDYICPELLKAIGQEPETDVQAELIHSLAKSIETLGINCLSEAAMEEVMKLIGKFMADHFQKADKRIQARNDDDYDDGVEETLAEEDENDIYLLSKIADIIHALFLINKTDFLAYFERLSPLFIKLLDPYRPWSDRQWGLCIFDDLIENCGPLSVQYLPVFRQPFIQSVTDKSPEVRQAAIYGCGVMGKFGGEQFALTCAETVPLLIEVINEPKSRESENVNATENAISALAKILQFNNSALQNIDEVIAIWFSSLPVVEDIEEAPHVYGYLCDLIHSNHPAILGNNNFNLPRIVSIFAEAFTVNAIHPLSPEGTKIMQIVKQIEMNPEVFQACLNCLSIEQKVGLEEAYREHTNQPA